MGSVFLSTTVYIFATPLHSRFFSDHLPDSLAVKIRPGQRPNFERNAFGCLYFLVCLSRMAHAIGGRVGDVRAVQPMLPGVSYL